MQRSLDRILTTHVGSLLRPDDLYAMIAAKQEGGEIDEVAFAVRVDARAEGARIASKTLWG